MITFLTSPKALLVLLVLALIAVFAVLAVQAVLPEMIRSWNPPSINKPSDPYDPRWWHARPISADEWRAIDAALQNAINDTEYDGIADVALMDALASVGVFVDNAVDARNAANHLLNRGYDQKKEQKKIQQEQKDAPQP